MAVTADKVVVELELKDGQYLAKVRQAEAKFNRSQEGMAKSAKDAERQIKASSGSIASSIRSMAAGIAAGASVAAIKSMGDAYTSMGNRLRVVGHEAGTASDQFDTLMKVATDSRADIESVVQTYSRLSIATEGMGFTQQQVTRTTEILSKALRSSGASAQETSAALLQFGQGVGSGALMGDELRSIRENAPLVAKAIAAEFNTTVGGLKKLGEEGKLTSERVVKAVLASGTSIDAMWGKTEATVTDALVNIRNNLIKYIGGVDDSIQGTERITAGLNALANNLDKIIPSLGVIATLFGVKMVASMGASAAATIRQAAASVLAAQNAAAHAKAVDAQNAANARLVRTGGAATAALNFQAASSLSAANAARAAGSSLLAMAGGPVVLAITGLAVALGFLVSQNIKAKAEFENLEKSVSDTADEYERLEGAAKVLGKETSKLSGSQDAAAVAAAALTGEVSKLADQHYRAAAAAKAQIVELLRLKAIETAEQTNQAVTSFQNLERQANFRETRRDSASRDRVSQEVLASREFEVMKKSAENARKATAELREEMERPLSEFLPVNKTEDSKKDKKGKKDKDRRQETLDDLKAQVAIEEAQLQGNEALVRQLEREAEIRARIKQLVDAGFSQGQAETLSDDFQKRIDAARVEDMERIRKEQLQQHQLTVLQINENIELAREEERRIELNELIEKHKKTTLSTEEAILAAQNEQLQLENARVAAAGRYVEGVERSHSLRIAEILGDKERVKLLTDQEEIVRRTNELRAQGLLSESEARKMAKGQVTAERAATDYAASRDFFASTFSEGMRAAMAGDLKGFLSSQFGNIADQAFRKLGETIYESIFSAPADFAKAQAEGVAQGVAAGSAIGTAMITSSVTAGSTIGGAMTAAGLAAAKAIAAAMATGSGTSTTSKLLAAFGGNRAGGGPVLAGSAYTVGESGRETFVPSQNGYIIPNMQNVRANAGAPSMVKLIVDEGSMFQARVEQISGPIAVQAAVTSTSYSNTQAKTSQRRRSQSFV